MQLIDALTSPLKMLQVYGVFGNFNGIYKYYSAAVLTFFYWPYLIYQTVTLIANSGDLNRVLDSYLLFSHVSTTVKFLNIIFNSETVTSILNGINSHEFNPYADGHKMHLVTQITHVKNVFKYFFGIANVTLLLMLLMPIIPFGAINAGQNKNETFEDSISVRRLPFDWSNSQFDITLSPAYEIAYFGQIQIGIVACHVCVAIDCFVSGLLHIVATQFDILSIEIRRLGSNDKTCERVQIEIENCVQHHIKLLSMSDQMSHAFSGVYLAQCCVTSIILCLTAVQIINVSTLFQSITLLSYMLCVIFELFMFCHYGNKIFIKVNEVIKTISQTGDILPAIYQSQWYLRECKCTSVALQRKHLRNFRQAIQIMMERAKCATFLSAANLFQLNYATFVTILKSGYSFFAVLNTTN